MSPRKHFTQSGEILKR